MADETEGLLSGITVLEMGHVVAAPTCSMLLADMGAEVIKVERLPEGDTVRRNRPLIDGESAYFAMLNRNKRGIALNMKSEGGRRVLKRLLGEVDVFVENYRTGAMAHYGIGYDQVREDCPRLIYCSISGFGQTGPYAAKGGFDLVAQGMSGLMSVTGEGPGRPPVKVGVPVTDITAGTLAALGITGAIHRRTATGQGQLVDTSLFEAGIMHTFLQSAIHLGSGQVPGAMGSAHPVMAPYQAFESSDGWLIVGAGNQSNWLKLTECLEAPELADDPRFAEPPQRVDHLDELVETLNGYFAKLSNEELLERLEAAGVPAGPVLDIAQMNADPQALARGMIQEVGSASGASMRAIGHPVKYSETPATIRRRAPLLGEHTTEVLAELGFAAGEIETLAEAGDIAGGRADNEEQE
ncbi:MAG: CoA transferase [Rhodospirillales bacterium]|jgi:crotonobetainyl-CoA:carnitine CoA-transferase CaiB-like acyl-CoA transferase|nr:CoA transferase [Rhodospirillaceae bacterium]MDP6429205.1 CoA transferase [Rhodospirillales bacterium]MDP6644080.1 CoA transferase [Rhodospirillales bacterium]MDP6841132.1 CoA transferase [Rhodospirillales bacterium]